MKSLNEVLLDPNEKIVSALGNNAIQDLMQKGASKEGFAVISDKRMYFRGNCLEKTTYCLRQKFEEKAVDINDVNGTGFEQHNPVGWLIGSLACLVTSGIMLLVMFS